MGTCAVPLSEYIMGRLDILQKKFNSPSVFVSGDGGIEFINIRNDFASAVISTLGGHLMSFIPVNGEELLWMSSRSGIELGTPVRGGVPLCFPWFGEEAEGMPKHGFARISLWNIESIYRLATGETKVVLALPAGQVFLPELVTFPFALSVAFTIGQTLQIEMSFQNMGSRPEMLSCALHTYFAVSAIEDICISGLAGTSYTDYCRGAAARPVLNDGDIRITGETCRVYMSDKAAVEICDPGLKRKIRVEKSGSSSTVIWNPWREKALAMPDFDDDGYLRMVCVEAANTGNDKLVLKAGESYTVSQKISIRENKQEKQDEF